MPGKDTFANFRRQTQSTAMVQEEGLVTLKEALTFIGLHDTTEMSDSSSATANINNSPATSSQTTKTNKPRAAKRKRSNLSSSTRLQQRNKAELLYLRKYTQELEEKRIKLDRGFSQAEMNATQDSVWMNLAKTYFQARLRSETTNRTLKTMLTSQAQVIDLLRDIIHKQTFGLEMDLTSVVKASANVSFPTEVDNTNSLKGVSVVCSEYFDTDMPLV